MNMLCKNLLEKLRTDLQLQKDLGLEMFFLRENTHQPLEIKKSLKDKGRKSPLLS